MQGSADQYLGDSLARPSAAGRALVFDFPSSWGVPGGIAPRDRRRLRTVMDGGIDGRHLLQSIGERAGRNIDGLHRGVADGLCEVERDGVVVRVAAKRQVLANDLGNLAERYRE